MSEQNKANENIKFIPAEKVSQEWLEERLGEDLTNKVSPEDVQRTKDFIWEHMDIWTRNSALLSCNEHLLYDNRLKVEKAIVGFQYTQK